MKPSALPFSLSILPLLAAALPSLSSPPVPHDDGTANVFSVPTPHDSAVLARRILHLSKLGTLSTVFQPARQLSSEHDQDGEELNLYVGDDANPASTLSDDGLAGLPVGLSDYVADCEPDGPGNPTILAIAIATSFRNVRAGSNISLSLRWTPPYPPAKRISLSATLRSWFASPFASFSSPPDTVPYSAANLPRFSLIGYLEPVDATSSVPSADDLERCFVDRHPDARYWLPGNAIHRSEWMRLVVTRVYWIGGFGDRAYIGWIPVDVYRDVRREEWEAVRLPGEEKEWKEWKERATGVDL